MEEILTLDQIVTEFVKDESNQEYIEFLEQKIMPICEKILSKQPQELEKREWSRKVDINESIENVYQFLKQEIGSNYANQFINIIRQERYGNVKVEILPKSEYKDDVFNEVDEKGRVHIFFNETPYDMFAIIHEMIHKMNRVDTIINNERYQTKIAEYFSESPSVMAEKLLGQWLVKNKKISNNDLRMVENDRLEDSKISVREVLIQAELIKMKQAGKELTLENVLQMLTEKANNTSNPIAEVFRQETEEPLVINFLLSEQEMTFFDGQQYIMAQHLADNLKNRENPEGEFRLLHEANADKDAEVEEIIETIDDYNTDPNNMDEKDKIINNAVLECIKNLDNRYYISNLETIKELCEEILKQPYPEIEQEEWSRKIDINESIEYNYQFLKTISPMLASQFMNLLHQYDANGEIVTIKPYIDKEKSINCCNLNIKKVFVYNNNTPEDIFILLHEMVHAMNYARIEADGKFFSSFGQKYIAELPSIIIERLLGKWLIKNKIITSNDYNLVKRNRLNNSKYAVYIVLIEKEIIDMKFKKGLYITRQRIMEKIKDKCEIREPENFSKEDEERCLDALGDILTQKNLRFIDAQGYVIGQYIANKVENENNPEKAFLRFHDLAGNVNLSPGEALRIIEEYQEEKDR